MKRNPKLVVALDLNTLEEARKLIDLLSPVVDIFKVGSQLFTACGPAVVRFILVRGKKVFLDLKYHDIPTTVANAVRAVVHLSVPVGQENQNNGVFMLTVHTAGGKAMLQAALLTAEQQAHEIGIEKPLIVGVTVLTSEEGRDNIRELVLERARLAKESGLDGVVTSVEEANILRHEFGEDFLIVTPGIRPGGLAKNDQKRVGTPKDAVQAGSDFLVVGRPIVLSENPLKSAQDILEEIKDSKL